MVEISTQYRYFPTYIPFMDNNFPPVNPENEVSPGTGNAIPGLTSFSLHQTKAASVHCRNSKIRLTC
ncbi:hypothetical protein KL86SPO_40640 [uncultured Sporomusa sp.]|uniref:Uncharacterized protein n=1 Tax=uncultured Sporomusa sp. TaxID=307249 RepID=A0A212LX30_9FIRM|nr:hypothetical protein KL86SPO_40640 [uncultured Sporomusa sp.]